MIGGDFNSSVVWDYPEKKVKFGDFMDDLESIGFASAYHLDRKCERGAEPDPTLWWRRNTESRYHTDYAFIRPADAIQNVNVGSGEDRLGHSDHPPVTVDLRL